MSPSGLESMIERKIAQAYAEGLFDNLEDAGQPLDLSQNPHQDPAWRLALHVLENAGLAPGWVEERRNIQEAIGRLSLAGIDHPSTLQKAEGVSPELFSEIQALNKRIESFNLSVPHPGFRLQPIRL